MGLTGFITAETTPLTIASFTLALIAISRAITAYGAHRLQGRLGDFLRNTFWVGAIAYAANAGLTAGLALHIENHPHIAILMISFALIFGAGIAVGNAGRPVIAIGQMCLTFLPICIAALINGTLPMLALAIVLPCMTAALTFVTLGIFTSLSCEVRSAHDSSEMARKMREQARTDSITRLANRTGFEVDAPQIISNTPAGKQIALFWLDLHRFKEINDAMGHQMGDRVLQEVAERLRNRAPQNAVIARFGSDEFLLLGEMTDRRHAESLADQLCRDMSAPLRIEGNRIETGASIGVELMEHGDNRLDRAMQNAGLALYHAKVAGRHQIRFFDEAMTRELIRRKEIETELRAAIQRDELAVYFQPIIDLKSGNIRSFEALVRWFHPEKGEVSPEEFIPVAEETGLIITLGNWITRQAARACANWPEHVKLAVNLSPVQIRAPGAALGILNAIKDAGLAPSRLELEVTESLFLEDCAETKCFIEDLSDEGVNFALDDFGTGYSSLGYINKYPFRTIKVDRSFVSGANMGRRSDAIIRAVAEMGSTLGMEIVAEGLETIEQVEAVRDAGCTLGQGYHFSRAIPEHTALLMLEEELQASRPRSLMG